MVSKLKKDKWVHKFNKEKKSKNDAEGRLTFIGMDTDGVTMIVEDISGRRHALTEITPYGEYYRDTSNHTIGTGDTIEVIGNVGPINFRDQYTGAVVGDNFFYGSRRPRGVGNEEEEEER